MALIVPDAAEIIFLKAVLNHTAPQDQTLKLFVNDVTPDGDSVVGTFTEASGGGYAAKSLTGTSWTVTTNVSDQAEAAYAAQTFTFTGPLTTNTTIYGYYVIQASSGLLLWAQRFANSFVPAENGDAFTFTPKIVGYSAN